jgi:AraC family transcriptional regulator, regulatory protein of adaptative response / methylated-DNA-[protein]-cysteine methyltransferase
LFSFVRQSAKKFMNMVTLFSKEVTRNEDVYYDAIVRKDSSFEGVFYTAVKTTGIFCRPTCTARKPKRENVEFFETTREAITRGYRPCKICQPLVNPGETPNHIREVMEALAADPSLKFKDYDLVKRGIEPNMIRRWFLKNHGITFHAYQRMFRINAAFKKIQQGEKVTAAAYDSGYESLSGFNDSFKSVFGFTPKASKASHVINLKRMETPLGTMIALAVDEGICLLEFSERRMLETEFRMLSKEYNAGIVQGDNLHFQLLESELTAYFEGKLTKFSVPIVTPGTAFQQDVWRALLDIPYGSTASYQQQAVRLGRGPAIRAVASANGMNKLAIIVPCHRVIGSDGTLTGYAGGLWRKQWLLDHEKKHLPVFPSTNL